MTRLVDRYGRTGAAAITSVIWALPMAAWAGSSDLSPIDQTAYPKVALAIGLLMLVAWFGLLVWIAKIPVAPRQRRLDLTQMSQSEKRWTLALIAFGGGLFAWLNAHRRSHSQREPPRAGARLGQTRTDLVRGGAADLSRRDAGRYSGQLAQIPGRLSRAEERRHALGLRA